MTVRTTMLKLLRDRRGATAVEYGLIVALITLVIVGAFQTVATETITMWGTVSDTVKEATSKGNK